MTTSRIYIVTGGDDVALVRATSQAQAVRYAARKLFRAEPASVEHLAAMASRGEAINVEDATDEANEAALRG